MKPSLRERFAPRTRLRVERLEDRCLLAGYSIVDLGTLGETSGSTYAYGINEHGQVVGESTSLDMKTHAFRWTPNGVNGLKGRMTDLGLPPGSTYTSARDINELGQVAGYSNSRGFIWDGTMNLLEPAGAYSLSRAYAINDRGDVAGWSGNMYYLNGRASLWARGAAPVELATIGTIYGKATDINRSGQVIGLVGGHAPNSYGGAYWTAGVPNLIGELATWGSDARAINDKDQIVGLSHISDGNWILARPFLYSPNGALQDLGTLECGAGAKSFGSATGINNRGQVVGMQGCVQSGTFATTHSAAVWDSSGGWQLLQNLIPPGSGWDLTTATAVNNRGHIIGYGFHEPFIDSYRAFVLVPDDGRANALPPIDVIDVQAFGADVNPSIIRRTTEARVHHTSIEAEATGGSLPRTTNFVRRIFAQSDLSDRMSDLDEIPSQLR